MTLLHGSQLTLSPPQRLLEPPGRSWSCSLAVLWPRRPGASVCHVFSVCRLPENTSVNLNIREQKLGFDMKRTGEEQPRPDCHVAFLSTRRFGLEDMHNTWKKPFILARGDKHICMALIPPPAPLLWGKLVWGKEQRKHLKHLMLSWGCGEAAFVCGANERWNAKFSSSLLSFWRHFSLFYSTGIFLLALVGGWVDHVTFLLSGSIACLVLKGKHTLITETSQSPEWETTLGFWLLGYLFWLLFSVLNTNQDSLTHNWNGVRIQKHDFLLETQRL